MCLHSFQLPEAMCAICKPPFKPKNVVVLGMETRAPQPRRVSSIPSRYVAVVGHPRPQVEVRCVGCAGPVNPAFCYRGSVLSDLIHTNLKTSQTTPVLGILETYSHATAAGNVVSQKVLGGHTIEGNRKVAFRKRQKGLLCDTCASCISTVEGPDGERVPVVITDARGDFQESAKGSEIDQRPFRKGPAFNTRFTQGRRGRRV